MAEIKTEMTSRASHHLVNFLLANRYLKQRIEEMLSRVWQSVVDREIVYGEKVESIKVEVIITTGGVHADQEKGV